MNSYFDHPTFRTQLAAAAARWLGTRWVPYSQLRGVGVSCHQLCLALYQELGVLPPQVNIPLRGYGAKHVNAAMEWLDGRPELARVQDDFRAGDLLLMVEDRLHFALVMPGENDAAPTQLIQCIGTRGVHYHSLDDATILRNLVGVWRPREILS